jgi:ABC-type uncharacterized transport system substrate-binding protein
MTSLPKIYLPELIENSPPASGQAELKLQPQVGGLALIWVKPAGMSASASQERTWSAEPVRSEKSAKVVAQEARNLEQQQVALIYTLSTSVSVAAKKGTQKIPIVFVAGTNPVAVDLVQSIPRPGGRLTGVQFRATDLTGKRLQILREIAPKLRRVVAFYDPQNPSALASVREAREAAKNLGLEIIEQHVASASQLQKAVEAFQG